MKKLIVVFVGVLTLFFGAVLPVSPTLAANYHPVYSSSVPTGATARCKDGTYSFSLTHRGTCSHHRGVSKWLK